MDPTSLPLDVTGAFFDSDVKNIEVLSGGKMNMSLHVQTVKNETYVLQKINQIASPKNYQDFVEVSRYLNTLGWRIPTMLVVSGSTDTVVFRDAQGDLWCAFEYLPNSTWNGDSATIGRLMARMHADLKRWDYKPKGERMVRPLHSYLEELRDSVPLLPTQSGKLLAESVLRRVDSLGGLPDHELQITHGDCKVTNMLHENGTPYTFIGWKTLMVGNVWFDIGDMMRSIAKTTHKATGSVNPQQLNDFIDGYYSNNHFGYTKQEFRACAYQAMEYYTLVLAGRYLADFEEGTQGYFAWDANEFSSRYEHNIIRAELLIDIADSVV